MSETELNQALQAPYSDVSNHEHMVAATGGYDIETGVITVHAQPRVTLTDSAQRERLQRMLQPVRSANNAITLEVIVTDELDGVDEVSVERNDGLSPAISASLVLALITTLLAGLWMRSKRHG